MISATAMSTISHAVIQTNNCYFLTNWDESTGVETGMILYLQKRKEWNEISRGRRKR